MSRESMRLLGGFELRRDGLVLDAPLAAHRLLGFLALNERRLPRAYVADSLWPDTDEGRAHANLRTALWRLHRLGGGVVVVSAGELALDPSLQVDVRAVNHAAQEYRRVGALPDPELLLGIRGELLPGCWDSWVVFDRERLRQETVQLLEASSQAALSGENLHLALLLGLGAVQCDPLRESANVLAIRVRLASGDLPGAVRHARAYARLLSDEIGVDAPASLTHLIASHRGAARSRAEMYPAAMAFG